MQYHLKCGLLLLLALSGAAVAAGPGQSLGRTRSTNERMQTERLKAATADVEAIKATRKAVQLKSGLNDYRAILHAHAEDASHTGGTRPEMLADAKKADVNVIMLSDHYRPPKDFITDTWRGMHEGVLFIPGSESKGFLVYPVASIADKMDLEGKPFIDAVTEGEGLIFLSHIEMRFKHPMDGLTGMEVYNRHADAIDDAFALLSLANVMTNPRQLPEFAAALQAYPDAMLASQLDYPTIYLVKWDMETQARRLTGVAANDCHHNMVMISKMVDADSVLLGTIVDEDKDMRTITADSAPGIREMTQGHQPGDILARLDFDPYYRSFLNESTHILAPELTEEAIRAALKAGHAYISHEWMCDAKGFLFAARREGQAELAAIMGDEISLTPDLRLIAETPVECDFRLVKDGKEAARSTGRDFNFTPTGPGVYRLETFLKVDGEDRLWAYSNPIYVR